MNFGSLCSGIEAASEAWIPLGWRAAFFSEIDAFPCAVLKQRHPGVPNHGDMTRFKEWDDTAIDVLVGGTPCQSFSVAGLRKGLADPRGNLMLTYLAIADRYRPDWLVWENVPGVLSDRENAFGAFLGGLAELGYGFAYRVLDAQYFGVPQRRRRVFVVGCLGDWRRAAAVLFERASLRGDPAPRRKAGERVAPTVEARVNAGGAGWGTDFLAGGGMAAEVIAPAVANPLTARMHKGVNTTMDEGQTMIAQAFKASHFTRGKDGAPSHVVPPLSADADKGDQDTLIAFSAKDHGADAMEDCSPTLRAGGHADSHANAGVMPAVAFQSSQSGVREVDAHATLDSNNGSRRHNGVVHAMQVRRLTPRECERLQGFPEIVDLLRITVCADEKSEIVRSVVPSSAHQSHAQNRPVAAHVLIDSERQQIRIYSLGECIWSASIAANESSSLLRMPSGDFARLIAGMQPLLERETQCGKVELPLSMSSSSVRLSGSASVLLSGREIEEFAADADRLTSVATGFMKSTTSPHGPKHQNQEQTLRTLSCCVAAVMGGCIPDSIRSANSYDLLVEVVTPYTLITVRGKPAADGPRYKALGNSMAVPVMAWIGERIQAVHELSLQEIAA